MGCAASAPITIAKDCCLLLQSALISAVRVTVTAPAPLRALLIAAPLLVLASPALAAPGLGDEVYGATYQKGTSEFEARYGALNGGWDSGEEALKLEAAHVPLKNLRVAAQVEIEREPGGQRHVTEASVEVVYTLGRAAGIDFAVYGEYAKGFRGGPDALEAKLILERRSGPFDARLNLVAERPLVSGERIALSYAASADMQVVGDVRAGVAAFGDLGTFHRFAPRAEHFLGPIVKGEVEALGPELEIEAGYLFPLAAARDNSRGQFRLIVSLEF